MGLHYRDCLLVARMDLYNYPVYVINLDRRPDRWTQFQALEGVGAFKKLKRWSATDGRTLDISANKDISLHTRYNIGRNLRRSHHEINTVGAIGASYSHYRIWKDLVDSSEPGALVFEDDVYLDPVVLQRMRSAWAHAPACDMFLFGTHAWSHKEVPYQGSYERVLEFNGAHAYYVSRSFAELLIKNFFPIEMHVEFYIYMTAAEHGCLLLRHRDLRVQYMSEVAKENDSDTFLSEDTCPLCEIPDRLNGVYMPYSRVREHVATLGAAALVFIGYLMAKKD